MCIHKLCVVEQEENKLILFSFQIAVFVAYVASLRNCSNKGFSCLQDDSAENDLNMNFS